MRLVFMVGTPKPQVGECLPAAAASMRLLKTEAEFRALPPRGARQ